MKKLFIKRIFTVLDNSTRKFVVLLDVSKPICNHLIGECHSQSHRKITGIAIMIFGVGITKVLLIFDPIIIHFIGDIVGYAFHGIGLLPFVNSLEKVNQ